MAAGSRYSNGEARAGGPLEGAGEGVQEGDAAPTLLPWATPTRGDGACGACRETP